MAALRYGIDTAALEAPSSAVEYARRLAQRDVDAAALVRAYRLGQARFIRRQALGAQAVALAAGTASTRLTPFAEVAPIALMCADVDALRGGSAKRSARSQRHRSATLGSATRCAYSS